MDRRMLLGLGSIATAVMLAALMLAAVILSAVPLVGSKKKDSNGLPAALDDQRERVATLSNVGSGLKAEAKTYRAQTDYNFADEEVRGELLRPESMGGGQSASIPTGPSGFFPAAAPEGPGGGLGLSEADRARVQAEMQALDTAALGVLRGTASAGDGSGFGAAPTAQNAPPLPPIHSDSNPLRSALSELPKPSSAPPNSLREPRIATGLGTASPSFAPAPAADAPSSPNPSGGAAPPPGGLDEIIRAFTENTPSPGSAGTSSPAASEPTGPAAPELTFGAAAPEVATDYGMLPETPAAADNSPFDVVEVFYGTDRQSTDAFRSDWGHILMRFVPTATVALLALCLGLVAAKRKGWTMWAAVAGGALISVGLGYYASTQALAMIRSAGKLGPRYTTQRSPNGQVEVGRCEITIPKTHERGELESPSIFRLEVYEDRTDHVTLQRTERLADTEFYEQLRERVKYSARRELFVFVHGFNVSFEDAARRTAQIHNDLKFDGAPIFFSWPANDKFILTYPADETNVAWSVSHLKQFLLSIVRESGAKSINLIAHSMGNRALAAALREIDLEMRDQSRLFNQVILAAPDIDADDFRNNIAPAMQRTAQRLTLYASSHDEALLASRYLHRNLRAGDAGDGLIVVNGVDTIDVTAIDKSLWGHAYYGSSHPVLQDLKTLFSMAVPPSDRTWLSPAQRDGLTYWIFQPVRTATSDGGSKR